MEGDGRGQVKTTFNMLWQPVSGSSASLAMALSILSALAEQPVYKNRFVTGTLEPSTGAVYEIGGVYHKALGPTWLHDLLTEKGRTGIEPLYIIFPAANLPDLTTDMVNDPFGMSSKICLIPITHFAQAYHLVTCGATIKEKDIAMLETKGQEALCKVLEKIERGERERERFISS